MSKATVTAAFPDVLPESPSMLPSCPACGDPGEGCTYNGTQSRVQAHPDRGTMVHIYHMFLCGNCDYEFGELVSDMSTGPEPHASGGFIVPPSEWESFKAWKAGDSRS